MSDGLVIFTVIFMIFVMLGMVSIESKLRFKLKNDERIINRLDLILKELNNRKQDEPGKGE